MKRKGHRTIPDFSKKHPTHPHAPAAKLKVAPPPTAATRREASGDVGEVGAEREIGADKLSSPQERPKARMRVPSWAVCCQWIVAGHVGRDNGIPTLASLVRDDIPLSQHALHGPSTESRHGPSPYAARRRRTPHAASPYAARPAAARAQYR